MTKTKEILDPEKALMKAFGEIGAGLFPAPLIIAADLERQYGVECLDSLEGTHARYYAVTVERQLEHPAVQAVYESAAKASRRPVLRQVGAERANAEAGREAGLADLSQVRE